MSITHDSLAVGAFKSTHGRSPQRSVNGRAPDESWIQKWKADYVAQLCRKDPTYAHYWALRTTWRARRVAERRLKAATAR
jgi:hypothetical protein